MSPNSLSLSVCLLALLGAGCEAPCDLSTATPVVHTTLSGSETWASGIHEVPSTLSLAGAAGHLRIEACSEVRLGPDASLSFVDGATLVAEGTAGRPIRFARQAAGSAWGNLLARSPSTMSLASATLEGGGGTAAMDSADYKGASLVARGSGDAPSTVLKAAQVVVKGSNGLGVAMVNARFDAASADLTVTGARWYPVYTGADIAGELPSGAYTGNAIDEVLLQSVDVAAWENSRPLKADVTLRDRGVPYRVGLTGADIIVGDGRAEGPDATLTLEPGVVLRFSVRSSGDSRLLVQGTQRNGAWVPQGALVAAGTASRPVTFTSAAAAPRAGDWLGLYFGKRVHPATRLDNAVVEYAGGDSGSSGVCKASNSATNFDADCSIIFFLEGDLGTGRVVSNTRIAHGLQCGVYRGWVGSDVDFRATNTFVDLGGCSQSNIPPPGQQLCDSSACPLP